MVKPFEEAAMKLQKNEVSGLVKTDFGWHILQATDRENARLKPFEEVRSTLATESQKQLVRDKAQDAIEKARAQLAQNPKNAQQMAAELGLQYIKAERVAAGDPVPGIENAAAIEAQSLRLGEPSQVFQLSPTKLGVAMLNSIEAPRAAAFADVQNEIRKELTDSKVATLKSQKMMEAESKLRNAKGDFAAAAKAMNLPVKSTQAFGMEGAADGIGPATYLAEAFTKPVGSVIGPITIGDQIFLTKVTEKVEANPANIPAQERETLIKALKQRKSSERREMFEDGIVSALIKEGKVKKYPESIKRLVSNYQG